MSSRSLHLKPPHRAEHIGSLLRSTALYELRLLPEEIRITQDLKAAEDEAIKHAVKLQQEVGIKSITDGELRRNHFRDGVFENLDGVKMLERPISEFKAYVPFIAFRHRIGIKQVASSYCIGKIKRARPFYVEDFKYLKSLVPPEKVKNIKITMIAPSWMHHQHGSEWTYDLSVYKNDNEYFDDVGAAYREEIAELYALGCRHIQIDNPMFCFFCCENMISGMEKAGVDHEALLDTYIRAINLCSQGRPEDLTFGVHMCRGNGIHFSEGGYDRIAVKLFNDLDVDTFYLEYDTERAGDFTPLKYLPCNRTAVLGLVTTKGPQLETIAELESRVNQAVDSLCEGNPTRTKAEALNQLCLSPQCGFASVWEGNPITEADQRKKLELLVAAAKHIWKE
ncbi:hypothetical protein BU17DRAFT_73467 [Hysterangium stoloniferum]|nr:hypothetical protein BU17DRAFT_73467 [Hysterangium stoloniferum]